MKVIIAGSRNFTDYEVVKAACEESGFEFSEVVSGAARGVDTLGEHYAKEIGVSVVEFPADWKNLKAPGARIKHGPFGMYNANAGHDRNKQMAKYADALVAIWVNDSPGTASMIKLAHKHGLKVFVKRYAMKMGGKLEELTDESN